MIIFVDCSKLRETLEASEALEDRLRHAETWLFNPSSTGCKRLKAANCQNQCRDACAHAPAVASPQAAEENLPPLLRKVKGAPWPPEVCGKVFLNRNGKKVRISGSGVRCEKACEASGCDRCAIGNTNLCAAHGGAPRCQQGGCNRGAIGKTDFCAAHGGGRRCESSSCTTYEDPRDRGYGGNYRAPFTIDGSVEKGAPLCYMCLGSLYPDKVTLKVRREQLLLAELDRRVPELGEYLLTQDCAIPGGCSRKRPDILYDFPTFCNNNVHNSKDNAWIV